jgi:hypothetical protein
MDVIQQIGAYAGLAAIVGLGVLSALYFAQARDLRRLREWAGRAPERSAATRSRSGSASGRAGGNAGAVAPGAAAPAPAPNPGQAQAGPRKPPQPSPAAPAAGGSPAPVAAGAVAPAAASEPAAAAAPSSGGGAASAPDEHGARAPSPAGSAAARSGPPAPSAFQPPAPAATRPATRPPGGGSAAGAGPPARMSPPRPAPGAAPPEPRSSPRTRERSSLPYVVLAVVGVLIVVGAGAFAVGVVGGRDEPRGSAAEAPGSTASRDPAGAVEPSSVTFSVLNGTGVDGLAKQVADELEAAGYRRGNVTNASGQQAESVVLYAREARREAQAVARELEISQTEPIDARSQALAGDASVVIIVGADQTR